MRTWTPLLVFSGLLACDNGGVSAGGDTGIDAATSGSRTSSSGTTTTTTSPQTGSFSSSSVTTESTTEDDGEDDGEDPPEPPITFDIGVTPDFGEFEDGCNAVDFLFVIDNSGSMGGAQANLVSNFPTFIDGIQSTLTDVESFHVGIATSDAYSGNPVECRQLGALVTNTTGDGSSNAMCGPFTEGFSYITEDDDLSASFQCAARVGTSGSFEERPMNALEAAIGPELNAEGACNDQFIRDSALLVVVVITDEADGPGDPKGVGSTSTGTPASWYQSVLDAKDGVAENAAALVLTNYVDGPCPPLGFGGDDGVNLVEFAGLFGENGFVAGICEPDYGPSFAQATAVIEQACENFIPPG